MKKYLLLLITVLLGSLAQAGSPVTSNHTTTINALDTVVIDLSQAVINGNNIQVPVSILSDDTIFALDFSFKFDQTVLIYDSIIDLTNYMQALAYYNTNDSIVRFTSNSFQQYTNDTALVKISFDLIAGQFNANDFNTIKVLLNGGQCTVKLVNVSTIGLPVINAENNFVKVFPNPAKDVLTVTVSEKASMQLLDVNGRDVLAAEVVSAGENLFSLQNINNGIYFLKVFNDKKVSTQKIVISN